MVNKLFKHERPRQMLLRVIGLSFVQLSFKLLVLAMKELES